MISAIFKKSVAISVLGHLTVFGLFGVSFGRRLPVTTYDTVIFQGSVLNNFDFSLLAANTAIMGKHGKTGLNALAGNPDIGALRSRVNPEDLSGRGYLKPIALVTAIPIKEPFMQKAILPLSAKARTALMFYPRLPPSFSIYFKDRQVVHMELMFKVSISPQSRSILIKRKVSSGNLEADLLCMRYINHYLFLRQKMFSSGGWQNVKIELSAKND